MFAQYVGIFVGSTFWFAIYCCFKKFKPQVYSQLVIPGMITGVMFGIGTGNSHERNCKILISTGVTSLPPNNCSLY